jgi:transcriptional regulator with XRE-family HTH domain
MGIYDSFAANLRGHCLKFESIAAVCRGIDINRQQFNKYLAGQMLPNSRTLGRICEFLKISEEELFQSTNLAKNLTTRQIFGRDWNDLSEFFESFGAHLKIDDGAVKDGYYYCYFPLPNFNNLLLRSLIKVTNGDGVARFERLTAVPSREKPRIFLARDKHAGIVFANSQEIYFLGLNRKSHNHCSLIAIDRSQAMSASVRQGVAITRGTSSQLASRVAIEFLGLKVNLRTVLKSLGPVDITCPSLSPHIVSVMAPRPCATDNQVATISEDRWFNISSRSDPT